MNAEVISFKSKNKEQDTEVINRFVDGVSFMESYNFFYLDATRDEINTTLEIQKWQNAITDMKFGIKLGILSSQPATIAEFAKMCKGIEELVYGGIIGVGFECYTERDGITKWSFMLVKLADHKYIIRDLFKNGKRIIIRG